MGKGKNVLLKFRIYRERYNLRKAAALVAIPTSPKNFPLIAISRVINRILTASAGAPKKIVSTK
jgi:hypothetical protein